MTRLLRLAAFAVIVGFLARRRPRPVTSWFREDDDGIQVDAGLTYDPGWTCSLCEVHFPGFPEWREHTRVAHLQSMVWS